MSALAQLSEDECYLLAILDDPSGIELAEFCFLDETPGKADPCFRVRDYQWRWFMNEERYQIDHAGRDLGKSMGILLRAFAFPFCFPGQEMLITAPQLNHLGPLVDKIERQLLRVRLGREMLPKVKGGGLKRQPQFQATFINGAVIMGRLPGPTGAGAKGQHAHRLEMDECFPAGTLILTARGQVPIEEVTVGDRVWTHAQRWRAVTRTWNRGLRPAIRLVGQGHPGLVCTAGHEFWARPISHFTLPSRRQCPQLERPEWIEAQKMQEATWTSPTCVAGLDIPSGVPRPRTNGNPALMMSSALMEVIGWWLAEGSVQPSGKITWSVHRNEVDDLICLLRGVGLRPWTSAVQSSVNCVNVVACHAEFARFLVQHCGHGALRKQVPVWALGASREDRQALLRGLINGDGFFDSDPRYRTGRWKLTTASKAMAVSTRLLALSLEQHVSVYFNGPRRRPNVIRGREVFSKGWYQVVGNPSGQLVFGGDEVAGRVRRIEDLAPVEMFDLEVRDDHSFVADGLIVHNSQDYPHQGWVELIETMKDTPGAQWRVHGVSRGVRDMYYRLTNKMDPNLPFYVHRYMAMHRPGWSPEERIAKISFYGGSRDNPDYKRNVYGEHGDITNPVFVLAKLMACVRINESTWASEYNEDVYCKRKLEYERIEDSGLPIEQHLKLPASHLLKQYTSYWAGMDIGYTNDPSELLVFGLVKVGDRDVLRLLTRIHMMRISAPEQAHVIEAVAEFYGPRLRALSLDKTGAGLPIWQETTRGGRLQKHAMRIKGYGFSEKKAVQFDDRELARKEKPEDLVIEKNVIEFATDELRSLVDAGMVELPFDQELLTEFQGQTVVYARDESDISRKRTRYGGGSFHTLDAAKLAVLGKSLEAIEAVLLKPKRRGPVLDQFAS